MDFLNRRWFGPVVANLSFLQRGLIDGIGVVAQ
jgi:hypothetical protein